MQRTIATAALSLLAVSMPMPAGAQLDFSRTPLAADHPLVGTWRFELPQQGCHELYDFRADGTMHATSGEQRAETEFEISAAPSARGFYKWSDRITRDNGKRDCTGYSTQAGHIAINYIALHPSGQWFALCKEEDFSKCIGPFVRQAGI